MPVEDKKPEKLSFFESLPTELNRIIAGYLDKKSLKALTRVSRTIHGLFQPVLDEPALLHAVFMSDVAEVERILRRNPECLFVKQTYRMPLFNEDGACSDDSVQIYENTSPLELSLYTGDWNVWKVIYPFIPEEKISNVHQLMQKVKRGGPDLVKINFDPAQIESWEKLQYFDAGMDIDAGIDISSNRCIYKLLGNPDGIICFKPGKNASIQYFYANQDTKKLEQVFPNHADDEVFAKLEEAINEMPMNSSCRSSDIQHHAIKSVFNRTLERNGIHSVLKGVRYQDTLDGCSRVINAYRKYKEIYYQHTVFELNFPRLISTWIHVVGLAQLLNMPRTNFFICDKSKPFHSLEHLKKSIEQPLDRSGEFSNFTLLEHPKQKLYPCLAQAGLGEVFGLYKSLMPGGGELCAADSTPGAACVLNLAALRLLEEVTAEKFNAFERDLAQRLQAASEKTSGPYR